VNRWIFDQPVIFENMDSALRDALSIGMGMMNCESPALTQQKY
jgi:hypothetical protein